MRKTTIKISAVLVVIIFLPIGFFLVNELTKLSQDEKMVQSIFNKQLESILFSVNQYSENVISYWVNNLDLHLACNSDAMGSIIDNILSNNPSIESVGFFEIESKISIATYGKNTLDTLNPAIIGEAKVQGLVNFLEKDYQKIESIQVEDKTLLYFVMNNQATKVLCMIGVNTQKFIQQTMGPQIQQVS